MAMKQWRCTVCGYVHEGETPPDECPICGVGPELFEPHEAVTEPAPAPAPTRWRCTVCDWIAEGPQPPDECPVCGAAADLFEPVAETAAQTAPAIVRGQGERLVIVGGGVAAVTAAERARRVSAELAITLVFKEPHLPYNRLNLTRCLAGEVAVSELELHDRDWYETQRIELVPGEALRLDPEQQRLELRSGQALAFDRLVLANGAHPFLPPIAGLNRQGVVALRTLDHVKQIIDRARSGAPCVCIGGGLLGLEVAGGLAGRGMQVTVLEGFDWLLPRQLAAPAGRLLQQHLEQLGISVVCNARVNEVIGDESVRAVRLEHGDELPADTVVIATGVRPNSFLARQAGIEVGSGVLVDDQLETSAPHIFAAGDVAEHRGRLYGLWTAAIEQGKVAGINAAGGTATFAGIPPATQLKVLDVAMFSIGEVTPQDGASRVIERQADGVYTRVVCRDGAIVGANLYGDLGLAKQLRSAIETGTQIADLGELLDRLPELRRHG